MTDLEARIGQLETTLGNNDPVKMSSLVTDTGSRGLFEVVDRLMARTALLDPVCVDRIDRQLALLAQNLQQQQQPTGISGGAATAGAPSADNTAAAATNDSSSVLEHPEQKKVGPRAIFLFF